MLRSFKGVALTLALGFVLSACAEGEAKDWSLYYMKDSCGKGARCHNHR